MQLEVSFNKKFQSPPITFSYVSMSEGFGNHSKSIQLISRENESWRATVTGEVERRRLPSGKSPLEGLGVEEEGQRK